MKDKFWFEHDSNAHSDPLIIKLRMRFGLAAYGAFWIFVEALRDADEYRIEMDMADAVCFEYRIEYEWFLYMVEIGLFETDGRFFWSNSLCSRMAAWERKKNSYATRGAAGGRAKAEHSSSSATAKLQLSSSSATAKLQLSSSSALAITEQNRTEQKNTEEAGLSTSLRSVAPMDTVVTSGDQELLPLQPNVFTPEDIKKRSSKKTDGKPKGSTVWDAYSRAYGVRYGTDPIRNAKANTLCARLCALVPADDAPAVAEYYLTTRANPYAQSGHCLDLLVRDAQKFHTEWKTGRRITQSQAREGDRLQGQGDVWRNVADKMKREGRLEE